MLHQLIIETKNRALLIFLVWISVFSISCEYREVLLFQIVQSNSFIDYFVITDITEIFLTYFELNQFLSHYFLGLYCFYHLFIFIEPGLYHSEYAFLKITISVYSIILLFITILTYFVGISGIWCFFIELQEKVSSQVVETYFETKLDRFLGFYLYLFKFLAIFSFLITILSTFSIHVTKDFLALKQYRRIFHIYLVVSTVLMIPVDPVWGGLTSIISLIIFELLLFFNLLKI